MSASPDLTIQPFSTGGATADRVKVFGNIGGIFAASALLVTNSVVSNNTVGIECDGTLNITNSQVAGIIMNAGIVIGNTIRGNGTLTNGIICSGDKAARANPSSPYLRILHELEMN